MRPWTFVPATVGATGWPYEPRVGSAPDLLPVEVIEPPVFGLAVETGGPARWDI